MKRDCFGICLNHIMLSECIDSTFTHVRAYEKDTDSPLELKVLLSFPQMTGKELLNTIQGSRYLEWRAEYFCDH